MPNAGVPMMSVVAGQRSTRLQAFLYSLPMAAVADRALAARAIPGAIYGDRGAGAQRGVRGARLAGRLQPRGRYRQDERAERQLFGYSIVYLFAAFGILVVDRLVLG